MKILIPHFHVVVQNSLDAILGYTTRKLFLSAISAALLSELSV